jgi:isoleucyl-tRNA synthetase
VTHILAPILPHLAEEIHHHRIAGVGSTQSLSVFSKKWMPLDESWRDPDAEADVRKLLRVRSSVLTLLERARQDKRIGRPAEADVDILVPGNASADLVAILKRERK